MHGGDVWTFTMPSISFPLFLSLASLKLNARGYLTDYLVIFVGVTYHSPLADNNILHDYLIAKIDYLSSNYPNGGIMLLGDYNYFDYLTIRLRDRDFNEVIVDKGEAQVNYHLIGIESE